MSTKVFIYEASKIEVVNRSIRVALVVGVILNLINQGSAIINGFQGFNLLQSILTFMVPYCVSTYSSVQAKIKY